METKHRFSLGDRVLCRSNNDEPYYCGVFKGYEPITLAQRECPLVEIEGVDYLVMGIIRADTPELREKLDKLTPKEQWNSLCLHYHRI